MYQITMKMGSRRARLIFFEEKLAFNANVAPSLLGVLVQSSKRAIIYQCCDSLHKLMVFLQLPLQHLCVLKSPLATISSSVGLSLQRNSVSFTHSWDAEAICFQPPLLPETTRPARVSYDFVPSHFTKYIEARRLCMLECVNTRK